MHVTEETHCGIVPMNHSNKDGTSSAESEEGRLRIKESASQSNTCPTQSGEACVSQGLTGVRTSGSLGRYSSEIRTGCAKERPSGSVRGAPGDWCPYRDRQLTTRGCLADAKSVDTRQQQLRVPKVAASSATQQPSPKRRAPQPAKTRGI